MLDPAPRSPSPAPAFTVDILTPTRARRCCCSGGRRRAWPPRKRLRSPRVARTGAKAVVLKLGDQGCFFDDGEQRLYQPAFPVKVADSTRPATPSTAPWRRSGRRQAHAGGAPFASAAAAISVTRPGAQAAMPARAEGGFLRTSSPA